MIVFATSNVNVDFNNILVMKICNKKKPFGIYSKRLINLRMFYFVAADLAEDAALLVLASSFLLHPQITTVAIAKTATNNLKFFMFLTPVYLG